MTTTPGGIGGPTLENVVKSRFNMSWAEFVMTLERLASDITHWTRRELTYVTPGQPYGATFDFRTGQRAEFETGYWAALQPTQKCGRPEKLHFAKTYVAVLRILPVLLADDETVDAPPYGPFVGVWVDDGVVSVEPTRWYSSKTTALSFAARERQEAVWDCAGNVPVVVPRNVS